MAEASQGLCGKASQWFVPDAVSAMGRKVDALDALVLTRLHEREHPDGRCTVRDCAHAIAVAGRDHDSVVALLGNEVAATVMERTGPAWRAEVEVLADVVVAARAVDIPLTLAVLSSGDGGWDWACTNVFAELAENAASVQMLALV